MATWRDFLPYILPDLADCPRMFAEHAARDAAIEFCTQSLCWRKSSDPADLVKDVSDYAFAAPEGSFVTAISRVVIREGSALPTEIQPVTYDEISRDFPDWFYTSERIPRAYWVREPGTITLVPTPSEDVPGCLMVDVFLAPTRVSEICPQFLFDHWAEAIGYGAKSRLMFVVGRPWSNAEAAVAYKDKFDSAISTAKGLTLKSRTQKAVSAQPKRF